ncbi:hypothetical protein F4780DRAFT_553089 [Xylariomycetidae sp. FL0641]|nr:hypothetical protein F4780DRAFT_553089 [Xylariomycetidae sp. FL0641]
MLLAAADVAAAVLLLRLLAPGPALTLASLGMGAWLGVFPWQLSRRNPLHRLVVRSPSSHRKCASVLPASFVRLYVFCRAGCTFGSKTYCIFRLRIVPPHRRPADTGVSVSLSHSFAAAPDTSYRPSMLVIGKSSRRVKENSSFSSNIRPTPYAILCL